MKLKIETSQTGLSEHAQLKIIEDLDRYIATGMELEDFCAIPGDGARDKARNLVNFPTGKTFPVKLIFTVESMEELYTYNAFDPWMKVTKEVYEQIVALRKDLGG